MNERAVEQESGSSDAEDASDADAERINRLKATAYPAPSMQRRPVSPERPLSVSRVRRRDEYGLYIQEEIAPVAAEEPLSVDSRKRIEYAIKLFKKTSALRKISTQLTGSKNYRQWRENMVMLLRVNSLLEIVTGEIQEPPKSHRRATEEPPKGHDLRFDWERLCLIAGMAILKQCIFLD